MLMIVRLSWGRNRGADLRLLGEAKARALVSKAMSRI